MAWCAHSALLVQRKLSIVADHDADEDVFLLVAPARASSMPLVTCAWTACRCARKMRRIASMPRSTSSLTRFARCKYAQCCHPPSMCCHPLPTHIDPCKLQVLSLCSTRRQTKHYVMQTWLHFAAGEAAAAQDEGEGDQPRQVAGERGPKGSKGHQRARRLGGGLLCLCATALRLAAASMLLPCRSAECLPHLEARSSSPACSAVRKTAVAPAPQPVSDCGWSPSPFALSQCEHEAIFLCVTIL